MYSLDLSRLLTCLLNLSYNTTSIINFAVLLHHTNTYISSYCKQQTNKGKGVYANAPEIQHSDGIAKLGIVTEDIKITFWGQLACIIWLVQIYTKIWEYKFLWSCDAAAGGDDGPRKKH